MSSWSTNLRAPFPNCLSADGREIHWGSKCAQMSFRSLCSSRWSSMVKVYRGYIGHLWMESYSPIWTWNENNVEEWKSSKKASKVDRVFIDAASFNMSLPHYALLNPLKRQKNWKCCFGLLLFFVNWVAATFADGTKRRKSEGLSFSCELLNWHIAWQNKRQN